jgi:alpha-aminoadipate carrier protein LysW
MQNKVAGGARVVDHVPNARRRSSGMSATCPNCAVDLVLDGMPSVSEVIACPDCTVELEVISVEPVRLGLAPEVEEDWGE